MTLADRDALDTLRRRIDHVAATSILLSEHGSLDSDMADAVRGVGETLNEVAARLDGVVNPASSGEGR